MALNDHPHPDGIVIAGQRSGRGSAELSLRRRIWQREFHRRLEHKTEATVTGPTMTRP